MKYWIPSEEQIKALEDAVVYYGDYWNDKRQIALESLLAGLKGLMFHSKETINAETCAGIVTVVMVLENQLYGPEIKELKAFSNYAKACEEFDKIRNNEDYNRFQHSFYIGNVLIEKSIKEDK